ncbi:MAG TPA: tetratricopeptide repeat protein [Nitrososphaeraceae archaeon]|nr:tetratricopeptide repeat protein [Nitrososphaeraceae archaeon]
MNNPGTSKQKVIDKLSEEGKGSRVTILNDIENLIKNGLILARKIKKNSPNYNLYVNDSYYKDLIDIYNEFERYFIEIVEKIKPQIFTDNVVSNFKDDKSQNQLMILYVINTIYNHFMAMVLIHAIFNWPEMIKDDEKRNKLNTIMFTKMQKLHKAIYESFRYESNKSQGSLDVPVLANTVLSWFKLNPSYLKSSIDLAKVYNLSSQMEKLLDIAWKVSYPLLPFARPLFEKDDGYIESRQIKWSKQNWRPTSWKDSLKYYETGFVDSELIDIIKKASNLIDSGKTDEALKCYDQVLSIDPNNLSALNDKGYLLNKLGRYNEALEYFNKALSIDPTYVDALLNKGNSLSCLNKHDKAINFYDQVLKIESTNFNASNNKGYELLILNNLIESQRYLKMAFKIEPENPLILYNTGLLLEKKGDYQEALKWFAKLLDLNPNHINGLIMKANILWQIGKEEESFPIFQQILKLDPQNMDALNGKGIYLMKYYKNKLDLEEALEYFNKALSIKPDDINTMINKGTAYNLLGKYHESIKCFDKVLKKLPNDIRILLFKAETLLDMMKYNEAIEYFDKLLSLDPSNERAKEGIIKAKKGKSEK